MLWDAARVSMDQTHLWMWVPALAPPGSRTGRGTGVCLAAGLQTLPCSSAARKSFLLSAEHQLTGRMLELSFLALPKFILPRAVVVYF